MESAIKYNPFIKSVLGKTKNRHLQVFLLGLGIATVFFIPFIVWDKGYFLFFGDFNVQQVPFYRHGVEAVHSGNIFWDWNTDLGANFIASYSFYNLGSPFFWIACLFPSSFAPYLMGPLLILKFACAGLTGYMFIRRFVKNQDFAVLGGLMYAFSGFSVYNIFFNHFHEAIVFFPLMLLGLELLMTEQKRGLFAATVFICAFSNYFFFVGMVVFVVIYWFLRMISGAWKLRVSDFFWMLGEAVAGVGMAAVLLVPSYIVVMQNPRVGNMLTGYSQLLYGKEQIFLNVIEVFFFPPDLPARPIFFPGADVKWSSLGGWLPLFGMTGVLAYFQTRRGTWLKRIISILIFMALVPLLNSAFYSLNSAYYARWFYMPVLMMSLATCVSLEDKRTNWTRALKWSIGVTVAFSLAIGFLPSHRDDELHPLFLGIMTHIKHFGLYSYNDKNPADSSNFTYMIRYWITCAIAIGSLAVLAILIPMLKTGRRKFANLAILCFSIITIAYSGFFIYSGKTHSYDTHNFIIPHLINQEEEMELPDKIGRVDVYNGMDNASMYLNMPGVQAFHSIVPQSIMDFYPYIGVERSVGSRPDTDHLGLRGLISVHWLLE
ncbi:MAG: YfhO family protein [Oscillospiraceae bacterium]|nr:YfhO family protein [Oscillospiraceae bacterium]